MWWNLLTAVAVIVALVSAGGLGLQRARVGNLDADLKRERGLTTSLREEVADLRAKRAEDRAENDRQRTQDRAEIDKLRTRLEYAERLATGEQRWAEMNANFQEHREQLMDKLDHIEHGVDELVAR